MNQIELTLKINQLKRDIKNLESSKTSARKKIKANQDILKEAQHSKQKFEQRISELHSNLNNRLNRVEGAFPNYYRKEHNDVLKKGDLDKASGSLTETINKAKRSIIKLEDETSNIDRRIASKKRELKNYQNLLLEAKGE